MTFHVGQKVVCVDDDNGAWPHLKKGAVYTVLGLSAWIDGDPQFLTINNVQFRGGQYRKRRFRPLIARKTDISIFTSMLNPSPVTVDAMNIADHGRGMVG